jgi:hypothetical protein
MEDSFKTGFLFLKTMWNIWSSSATNKLQSEVPSGVSYNEIRKLLDFIDTIKISSTQPSDYICILQVWSIISRKELVFFHELLASHCDCIAEGFVGAATLRATGERKALSNTLALLMFSQQNSNCRPVCLQKKYFLIF